MRMRRPAPARRRRSRWARWRQSWWWGMLFAVVAVAGLRLGYSLGSRWVPQPGGPTTVVQTQTQPAPPTASLPVRQATRPETAVKRLDGSAATVGPEEPSVPALARVQQSGPAGQLLYRVQVGNYSARHAAESLRLRLQAAGYEGFVTSGPPYRVQVGAFSGMSRAQDLAVSLRQDGFEPVFIDAAAGDGAGQVGAGGPL